MQHSIPVHMFGAEGEVMARAVEKCVHCGFCLAACPTYAVMGEEMDSPRGRIILMKSVLEGSLALEEALPYVDRCLGCQSCVPACPSGVPYGELLTPFRAYAEKRRKRPLAKRAARYLVKSALPHPARFRLAVQVGKMARPVHGLLPDAFRPMFEMLPNSLPPAQHLPAICPAQGVRRARVALLAGCVQQALDPEINWATLRVLAHNGVEVLIPPRQGCCGALDMHTGDADSARALAAQNLKVFPKDVDAILTNAAGCGSGIREYSLLFKGTAWEEQADEFKALAQDVTLFLDRLGLVEPPPLRDPARLAYHDACHLAHAQGVTTEPRRLLQKIPNLELLSVPEGEYCCGSAGTYNLEQPETAQVLGDRKARNILSTGAGAVATGNIGCMVQLRRHMRALGIDMPVLHTMQVLDRAYRGLFLE